MDQLMEGEDFVEGESLDSLVLEELTENIELDDDALMAIEAAQEFMGAYNDELLVEAGLEGDENSSKEARDAKAAAALDAILATGSSYDAALAVAGDDVADAEGVEDKQGPRGFRKYDEDEMSGMSEEQRDQVATYKLTKTELANLVPEVRTRDGSHHLHGAHMVVQQLLSPHATPTSFQDWDTINVDWFTNRKEENIPLPEYKLNFIWTVGQACLISS